MKVCVHGRVRSWKCVFGFLITFSSDSCAIFIHATWKKVIRSEGKKETLWGNTYWRIAKAFSLQLACVCMCVCSLWIRTQKSGVDSNRDLKTNVWVTTTKILQHNRLDLERRSEEIKIGDLVLSLSWRSAGASYHGKGRTKWEPSEQTTHSLRRCFPVDASVCICMSLDLLVHFFKKPDKWELHLPCPTTDTNVVFFFFFFFLLVWIVLSSFFQSGKLTVAKKTTRRHP